MGSLDEVCRTPAMTLSALEETYGIQVSLVAISMLNGVVDVRIKVVDPGKAHDLLQNQAALLVNQQVLILAPHMHSHAGPRLKAGKIFTVFFPTEQTVHSGSEVSSCLRPGACGTGHGQVRVTMNLKLIRASILAALLLSSFLGPVELAQANTSLFTVLPAGQNKIDASLQKELGALQAGETITVIVQLRQRANLPEGKDTRRAERLGKAIQLLKATASSTQGPVQSFLKTRKKQGTR